MPYPTSWMPHTPNLQQRLTPSPSLPLQFFSFPSLDAYYMYRTKNESHCTSRCRAIFFFLFSFNLTMICKVPINEDFRKCSSSLFLKGHDISNIGTLQQLSSRWLLCWLDFSTTLVGSSCMILAGTPVLLIDSKFAFRNMWCGGRGRHNKSKEN